jgi:hypothetical protein
MWKVEAFELHLDVAHLVVAIRITFFSNNIEYSLKY